MSQEKAKTLDEKQQRKSLSGAKNNNNKGLNRSIRNVLAKPYGAFWPITDTPSETELAALLQSLLPAAQKKVTPDDRKRLRKMQGKRMKEARKILSEEIWERNPGSKELRNCLSIGVNDVARGLEDNELASILISNEADPPILTRHLATLAATRNVPHVVLQTLKDSTKKSLDFAALTIGLKHDAAESSNHFYPIHEKIVKVFKTIAENVNSGTKHRSAVKLVAESTPKEDVGGTFRDPQELYLMRKNKNERVFVPGMKMEVEVKNESAWPQYISFNKEGKNKDSLTASKSPQEVLGSSVVADTRSFLQKVRDAKKAVVLPMSVAMDTGSFVSLNVESATEREETKSTKKINLQNKPVQRYFSSLAPLKVKRIQGNPMKTKKMKKLKKK